MRYLTQHFSFAEFTASEKATRKGIDNSLPPDLEPAAFETARLLERIRDHLKHLAGRDIPMFITSGYRCLELNREVGSADDSHHVLAAAADFVAPRFGSPTQVAQALASQVSLMGIGQLINEYPDRNGWVHVSTRPVSKVVNRIITITGRSTYVGIQAA